MRTNTKKLVALAMLSAIAYIVMVYGRIPIIPAVSFLKYDPKDVVIVISGFIFGPFSAFTMSAVVSLIEMITVSENSYVGLIMNVISTCSFACTAAIIYKKKHTISGAVIGLISGVLLTTAVMLLWNYFITPIYMKVPRDAVVKLLVPGFLPFNLIKYGLNAAITMLLYKPIKSILEKSNMLPRGDGDTAVKKKINIGVLFISLFVIITCVLLILVLGGKI